MADLRAAPRVGCMSTVFAPLAQVLAREAMHTPIVACAPDTPPSQITPARAPHPAPTTAPSERSCDASFP